MLQFAKMKNPLATEHPANDEVEQDTMNRKNRVVRFAAREATHGLSKLDLFEIGQKDFDATEARGILQRKFGLDFADGCGKLHLKGAPLFG